MYVNRDDKKNENELKRINAKMALKKSFGTWSDENHPDLKDSDAIAKWVAENRTAYDYLRNTLINAYLSLLM